MAVANRDREQTSDSLRTGGIGSVKSGHPDLETGQGGDRRPDSSFAECANRARLYQQTCDNVFVGRNKG